MRKLRAIEVLIIAPLVICFAYYFMFGLPDFACKVPYVTHLCDREKDKVSEVEKDFVKKNGQAEWDALVAAAKVDGYGEDDFWKRGKAMEAVVHVVLRFKRDNPSLSYTTIFEKGDTLYPPGWRKPITFLGRSVSATLSSLRYPKVSNAEVKARVATAIRTFSVGNGCATYIVRPEPGYESWTNERQAGQWIRKNMKRDTTVDPNLKTEYYCSN